ncbi:unnamed protein product [Paramecium sonneborni]|uniref:Uncharacterized protein n=1 Tax=Paramecium sonneborni TaxID=65129 RepID=A0A8S1QTG2_9CILI|nr:unnamed protein product [Paramecium sonneborni]
MQLLQYPLEQAVHQLEQPIHFIQEHKMYMYWLEYNQDSFYQYMCYIKNHQDNFQDYMKYKLYYFCKHYKK